MLLEIKKKRIVDYYTTKILMLSIVSAWSGSWLTETTCTVPLWNNMYSPSLMDSGVLFGVMKLFVVVVELKARCQILWNLYLQLLLCAFTITMSEQKLDGADSWWIIQTMVHNTLYRKLNIEPHWNPVVNWGAPEELAVPALVVEPVVWLNLSVYILMSFDFPFVKLFGGR
jgi:hypothetical protein